MRAIEILCKASMIGIDRAAKICRIECFGLEGGDFQLLESSSTHICRPAPRFRKIIVRRQMRQRKKGGSGGRRRRDKTRNYSQPSTEERLQIHLGPILHPAHFYPDSQIFRHCYHLIACVMRRRH